MRVILQTNRVVVCLISTWLCISCAHTPSFLCPISVHKGKSFQIVHNEKKGWGYYSHPIIVQYDPELLVIYYNTVADMLFCPAITVDEAGSLLPEFQQAGKGPVISKDGGLTWRIARPSIKGIGLLKLSSNYPVRAVSPAYNYSIVNFPNGSKAAYISPAVPPNGKFGRNVYISSAIFKNEKGVWNDAQDVHFYCEDEDCDQIVDMIHLAPRAAVLSDGSIVTAAYTTYKIDEAPNSAKCAVFAFQSLDHGRSFRKLSIIATHEQARWGDEGPCEPAIATMPNGDLLCIMRTGDNKLQGTHYAAFPMLEARSQDGGRTWKLKKMSISGVMPKLVVMRNGVAVLATGRPGNMLYFSTDNGHSWCRELAITPADILTSGYIDILETAPNRLLAVYDIYNSPLESFWLWEPTYVNGIFGTFIDVKTR